MSERMATRPRIVKRQGAGPPVYAYQPAPGTPPVGVLRMDQSTMAAVQPPGIHAHDFPGLAYYERGSGSLRSGEHDWQVHDGDAFIVAPGEVVGLGSTGGIEHAEGWAVYFTPEALGPDAPGAFLSWRTHPLLFPFVRGERGGVLRLRVPARQRPRWSERCAALDLELRERRDGYREAVMAHLALLLVDVSRLAGDIVNDLRLNDEPLLAEVFRVIEERHHEPISLRHVARAVSLSPGHLTTVVRRRTGRTVQQWINERRLAQARRLLVETDLTIEEIGRRAGYADPAYFARSFRGAHGVTPRAWRRASRS